MENIKEKQMLEMIEKMDETSKKHCEASYSFILQYEEFMNETMDDEDCEFCIDERLKQAIRIMDIGKIYIADYILNKGPELTEFERKEIAAHGYNAYRYLKDNEIDNGIPEILLLHTGEKQALQIFSEKEPGKAFPDISKEIRTLARTLGTVDSFIGMIQPRKYRPPFTKEAALSELKRRAKKDVDQEIIKYIEHHIILSK